MIAAQPWGTLGIEPTSDRARIRSAYAEALKAIDVDADPTAFMALREARDAALALAATLVLADEGAGAEIRPAEVRTDRRPHGGDGPTEQQLALHWHQQALIALMLPGGEAQGFRLTEEELESAKGHLAALAEDPRLSNVETFGDASQWFAELVARGCPRSDPLLEAVANMFNWPDEADISASPALAFAVSRRAALHYRASLSEAQHPLHAAWIELRRPANEHSRRGWVRRRKVQELLGNIRARYPTLEGELDWLRVQMWDTGARRSRLRIGLVLFVLWLLVQAYVWVGRTSEETNFSPEPQSTQSTYVAPSDLISSAADIDWALDAQFGDALTGLDLKEQNPELYQRLVQLWDRERQAHGNRSLFADDVRNLLSPRLGAALAMAPPPIQARAVTLRLRRTQAARDAGWAICGAWVGPSKSMLPQLNLGSDWENAQKRVFADALKSAPTAKVDKQLERNRAAKFPIPGALFQTMVVRSRLPEPVLQAALVGRGTDEQRCRAEIALLEVAASAKGPTAVALRRHLLGGG